MAKLYKLVLFASLLLGWASAKGQQQTTLEACIQMATSTNVLSGTQSQYEGLQQVNNDLLKASKKPQLTLDGEASIQSESMALDLDLPIPNSPSFELPLYKAKLYGSLLYPILDGDLPELSTKIKNHDLVIHAKNIDVQLYNIKSSITELFFNIKMLDKKVATLETIKIDLDDKFLFVLKAIKGGVSTQLDANRIEAEILKIENEIANTISTKKGFIELLNTMTGGQFTLTTVFDDNIVNSTITKRPELAVLDLQSQKLALTKDLIDAKKKPKLSAFAQAGVGYPNPLNFFDDAISPYAIGGIKLQWPITDWGASDKQKEQLVIHNELVIKQKDAFVQAQEIQNVQLNSKIHPIQLSIAGDRKRLVLQNKIVQAVESQFKNGVVNSIDYLAEVNKKAKLSLGIKTQELQIKMIQAQQRINNGW